MPLSPLFTSYSQQYENNPLNLLKHLFYKQITSHNTRH